MRAVVTLCAVTMLLAWTASARADDCPRNPDALGTQRVITVDPTEHPGIGTLQYPESLPLNDKEVVLSFDDGPADDMTMSSMIAPAAIQPKPRRAPPWTRRPAALAAARSHGATLPPLLP